MPGYRFGTLEFETGNSAKSISSKKGVCEEWFWIPAVIT